MAYFQYQGHSCYYEERGEGRPLLLLHGNTASSRMFEYVAGLYSDDYKVVLIDFLGHGRSDRLDRFPADLWYDEGMQVVEFLRQKGYKDVYLIGSSGGAQAALNAALEGPELVAKVVADSFEGEVPLKAFTRNIVSEREESKNDRDARMFYQYMHEEGWEKVVDNDTDAILRHDRTIGKFFHKPLESLRADILMTGSREDEFICGAGPDYFDQTYGEMLQKTGHGSYYLFEKGSHPAMLSSGEDFARICKDFLGK